MRTISEILEIIDNQFENYNGSGNGICYIFQMCIHEELITDEENDLAFAYLELNKPSLNLHSQFYEKTLRLGYWWSKRNPLRWEFLAYIKEQAKKEENNGQAN